MHNPGMTSPQGRQPRGLPFKLQSPPSGYEQPTKRELRTASDRVDYPVSERRFGTFRTKVTVAANPWMSSKGAILGHTPSLLRNIRRLDGEKVTNARYTRRSIVKSAQFWIAHPLAAGLSPKVHRHTTAGDTSMQAATYRVMPSVNKVAAITGM